jgi:nitrous oxide reductase accessory protein NosL
VVEENGTKAKIEIHTKQESLSLKKLEQTFNQTDMQEEEPKHMRDLVINSDQEKNTEHLDGKVIMIK